MHPMGTSLSSTEVGDYGLRRVVASVLQVVLLPASTRVKQRSFNVTGSHGDLN